MIDLDMKEEQYFPSLCHESIDSVYYQDIDTIPRYYCGYMFPVCYVGTSKKGGDLKRIELKDSQIQGTSRMPKKQRYVDCVGLSLPRFNGPISALISRGPPATMIRLMRCQCRIRPRRWMS